MLAIRRGALALFTILWVGAPRTERTRPNQQPAVTMAGANTAGPTAPTGAFAEAIRHQGTFAPFVEDHPGQFARLAVES